MIDLISKCESMGHQLERVGARIQIENAAHLPDNVRAEIIEHKTEILSALDHDEQAKAAGALIGISGTLYLWPVSRSSTAYMERVGGGWIAYRESYIPGKSTANSFKVIGEGNTFDYIFSQYKSYIEYVIEKRGGKRVITTAVRQNSIDHPSEYEKLSLEQKRTLKTWITQCIEPHQTKSFRGVSSYAIKHIFENTEAGFYITNGQMKGALDAAGFEPKDRNVKNWEYALSKRVLDYSK